MKYKLITIGGSVSEINNSKVIEVLNSMNLAKGST